MRFLVINGLVNAILRGQWHFASHESHPILQQHSLALLKGYPNVVVLVRL